MARRLLDLRIHEVSLVDMPANKRKFAIIKRQVEKEMDKLKKMVEAFLGKELDKEAVAKAELEPEIKKMLEEQLELIEKYRSDLPVDVAVAIGTLSQHAAFGITKAEEDESNADDEEEEAEDEEEDGDSEEDVTVESLIDDVVEKATSKFTESTQKVLTSITEKLEKAIESLKGQETEEDEDEEIDEETLQKMIDARVAKLSQ